MFHPSAAENFDARTTLLLRTPSPVPYAAPAPATFQPEFHAKFELGDSDIAGEPEKASVDYRGRTVSRSFFVDRREFEVGGEAFQALLNLAETIQRHGEVSLRLSIEYIEKALFQWIRNNHKAENPNETFTHFLVGTAKADVRKAYVWTPIANFHIQSPLHLSRSQIKTLASADFDRWRQLLLAKEVPPETIDVILEDLRHKHQGHAAIVTPVEAEPGRATEIALEEAELLTSILALFSSGIQLADVACTSRISGCEYVRSATRFFDIPGETWSVSQSVIDPQFGNRWALSDAHVAALRPVILDPIASLLNTPRSAFGDALLNSLLIYSKAAFTADAIEKLVYCLTALESLLLKSESEPIQQNLAERLAVFIAPDLASRKEIVKCVRDVYAIRSKYLHHGKSLSELKSIESFLGYVWRFWVQVAPNIQRFRTKSDFIVALDDHKLS